MCVQGLVWAMQVSIQNLVRSLLRWAMPQPYKTWFSFQINLQFTFSKDQLHKWPIACLLKKRPVSQAGRRPSEDITTFLEPSTHRHGGKKSIWKEACQEYAESTACLHFT